MKYPLGLAAFFGTTVATIDFGDWRHPEPGDVRSPCPALNSLANHGIIPRDGKNLTVPLLVEKIGDALNMSAELATTVARAGLRTSSDPSSGAFNLDDLKKHNIIEHDGSLSRKDHGLPGGPEQEIDQDVLSEFFGHFENVNEIGLQEAATARWGRISTSNMTNSKFTFGPSAQLNSYVESAVYSQLLRNPKTQKTPVDWIKIFFGQERLPFAEGWRPVNRIDPFTLVQLVIGLALRTPKEAPAVLGNDQSLHGLTLQRTILED